MKLIKVGNFSFMWFFTIAVHFELKKIDRNIFTSFFSKSVKTENRNFSILAPQPIKIQIHSASQNDCLDFSFLKDIHAIAKKLLERGVNR